MRIIIPTKPIIPVKATEKPTIKEEITKSFNFNFLVSIPIANASSSLHKRRSNSNLFI